MVRISSAPFVVLQLTKTLSEGDAFRGKRGFYGFKKKPGKAAKVLTRLVKESKQYLPGTRGYFPA